MIGARRLRLRSGNGDDGGGGRAIGPRSLPAWLMMMAAVAAFGSVWSSLLASEPGSQTKGERREQENAARVSEFRVRFTEKARKTPFTGRLYLIFTQQRRQPRFGPSWFRPEQFLALDVKNLKPGETVTFSAENKNVLSFPKPMSELSFAGYHGQAVARFNPHDRNIGTGEGNGVSTAQTVPDAKSGQKLEDFVIETILPPTPFRESKWIKLLRVRSKLLSDFLQRDVFIQGSVRLPASYFDEPTRRYPVILTIPGFGGTHEVRAFPGPLAEKNPGNVEFLRVQLDPSCPLGHHVFADSANNGPWGAALVRELIPALDQQYRTVPRPTARFLTGHSSGGWSSLWLQVTYPETFGGTWSTAPDPVDFHDFQRIDIYRAGENMYLDRAGQRRPLARVGGEVRLWYRDFADMEWVLGPGGQLHSFEAVFSPRSSDGTPLLLWDRKTGAIDPKVAESWKKYDIRLVLESNWKTLGPKLAGKIHVFMGDEDTFYLEGATVRLKESLKKLKSDAVVEIHPGHDHGSLLTSELMTRIRREMAETFLKHHRDTK